MQRRLARSASALLSLFLLPGILAAATALKPISGKPVKTAVSTAVRDWVISPTAADVADCTARDAVAIS